MNLCVLIEFSFYIKGVCERVCPHFCYVYYGVYKGVGLVDRFTFYGICF